MSMSNLRMGFILTGCLFWAGCGSSGPPLGDVRGKVTLDGKPVPRATLEFVTEGPGGSPSFGMTDKDGYYKLEFSQDKSGALLGKHIVTITTKKLSKDELPDDGRPIEEVALELPKKFGQKGNLSAEVKSGSNTIDFPLESK